MLAYTAEQKKKNVTHISGGAIVDDNDAIERLSLWSMPLSTFSLKNSRLVKNARTETALEIHSDTRSGSLQIDPDRVGEFFNVTEHDRHLISSLSTLHSFDVYSLRHSLKKIGVPADKKMLSLSETMKEKLSPYTGAFTRPLVQQVFGAGDRLQQDAPLYTLLSDSDTTRVRDNLVMLTKKTGIPLEKIPAFISDYSDIFMSIAYYRHQIDAITPVVERFIPWMRTLESQREVSSSPQTLAKCKKTEQVVTMLHHSVKERMNKFHPMFESFWSNINQESFNTLRSHIENSHVMLGAVVCGLAVKMRQWDAAFPTSDIGGPQARLKFVMAEVEPGMDYLRNLENTARLQSGLRPL